MEATLWPYGKCEKCANKNYCAWSNNEILNCMNNGYPNFSPMRNADRMRAMSDEELAKWFGTHACCMNDPFFCSKTGGSCKACWLDWLRQEAPHDQP